MPDSPTRSSISGAGQGQGRDTMTGRFSKRSGLEGKVLAHMVSPDDTGVALLEDLLERVAPTASAVLRALQKHQVASERAAQQAASQNGPTGLLR